jgi:hypothetical protein
MPQDGLELDRASDSHIAENVANIANSENDEDKSWRIESKGGGRFCLRSGSGRNRIHVKGYYLYYDDLTDQRKNEYEHNSKRDTDAKARSKAKWGS